MARCSADTGYALRGAVHAQGQSMWISDPSDVRLARSDVNAGALMLHPWEAVAFASRLDCGPRTARVGVVRRGDRDVTRMTIDGERYELDPVVSASGARYESAGDPTTHLWVKGNRATLTLRGETLPECTVTRDAPDAVRAHGNEPGWRLELGTALLFVGPDFRIEGTAPAPQYAGGVRQHAGIVNGRSINVALAPRICRDSMTGMPHPLTAEVTVSGRPSVAVAASRTRCSSAPSGRSRTSAAHASTARRRRWTSAWTDGSRAARRATPTPPATG